MATQTHNPRPQPDTIIAIFGDVTEDNDRIAQIEVCPGRMAGEHRTFTVRCWGRGYWRIAHGRPTYFGDAAEAKAAALRWVKEGSATNSACLPSLHNWNFPA